MLATEAFVALAREVSASYGASGERILVVPHPLGATPEPLLLSRADAAVDAALRLLRGEA